MKKLSIQNLTISINQEKYSILSFENKTDKYILYINPTNKQDDLFEKMEFKEELNITPKKKLKDLNFNVKIDTEKYTYSLYHGNNPVYFLKNNKNIIVNNLNFKLILGDGKIYSIGSDKNIVVNDQCPTKLNIIKSEPEIKKNLVDSILEKSDSKDLEDKKKLINSLSEKSILESSTKSSPNTDPKKVEVSKKSVLAAEPKKVEVVSKPIPNADPKKVEVVQKSVLVDEPKKVEVSKKSVLVDEPKKVEAVSKSVLVAEPKKVEVVEKLSPVNEPKKIEVSTKLSPVLTTESKKVEVQEALQISGKTDQRPGSAEINLDTIVNDYNNLFNKDKAMDLFNPVLTNSSDCAKTYPDIELEKSNEKVKLNAISKAEPVHCEKLKPVSTKSISNIVETSNKKDSNLADQYNESLEGLSGHGAIEMDLKQLSENESAGSYEKHQFIQQIPGGIVYQHPAILGNNFKVNPLDTTEPIDSPLSGACDKIQHYYNTSINYKNITYHFNTMNLESSPNLNFSNLYVTETSTNNIIDNDSLAINLENKNNSYLFIYFKQKYLLNKINNSIVLTNLNTNNSQILKNGDIFKISNNDFLLYSNGTLLVPLLNQLGDNLINSRNLTQ